MKRDNSIIIAAAIPNMFKYSITIKLSRLNLFFMNVPKLLNIADDKFAAKPIKAFYLPVNFCPSNITPNKAPYVQFMPTIVPHEMTKTAVLL